MAVSGGRAAALEGAGHVLSLREISDKTLEPQTVCPPSFSQTKVLSCVATYFPSDKQNFLSSPV